MDELQLFTERVDDLPLLAAMLDAMGIAEIVDDVLPRHGNWKGLSPGQLTVGWLMYVLSQGDHRLSLVEPWAQERIHTLSALLGEEVRLKDFTDDRLGALLGKLGEDATWEAIEDRLNQHHLRVFLLPTEVVRLDATTASVYHDVEGRTLIGYGHSKDHRPDLAQVKVFVGALDPMALPLVTQPLPGHWSDDPLYIPAIDRVRESLGAHRLLYVGDSKMEKRATRAHIVQGGDAYLLPLSQKHQQGALLAAYVAQALADESQLEVLQVDDEGAWLLRGREWVRSQRCQEERMALTWEERVLVVQSRRLYEKQRNGVEQRLTHAEAKIRRLTPPLRRGVRSFRELAPLQKRVEDILRTHRVQAFLKVTYYEEVISRPGKPAHKRYRVEVERQESALQAHYPTLGWRLYVTSAPKEELSMARAMRIYRQAPPTIEHLFSRFKGRPLGLRPLFLRREDRIKGLVRLLSLALRTLTLLEFVARRALAEQKEALTGLYPSNPTKATSRPTAERLLQAFEGLHLTHITLPGQRIQHLSPLSPLQNRILQLLKFSPSIYTDLAHREPVPI